MTLTALGACAAACASGSDREPSGSGDDGDDTAEELSHCSATNARRFDVYLDDGARDARCTDVRGIGGTWVATPLFPDAPADVLQSSCRLTWTADVPRTPADTGALDTLDHVLLAVPHCTVTQPTCSSDTNASRCSGDVPVEEAEPMITPLGGASGCDVCGKIRNDKLFVILPPGERAPPIVDVPTSRGSVTVKLIAPPHAQAISGKLPPLPGGERYLDGRAHVY